MENLYQQTGTALSLKPDYESTLLSLCSTILEYFAASFALGRALSSLDNVTETKKKDFVDTCEQLIESIREKDQHAKASGWLSKGRKNRKPKLKRKSRM